MTTTPKPLPSVASSSPLPTSFYNRPTLQVAEDLIGCHLHRQIRLDGLPEEVRGVAAPFVDEAGMVTLSGKITETEGYLGAVDDASHSHRGPTPRTEVMFEDAGHAYVYLIYGMYWCLNLVTEKVGQGEAVLIRGLEPTVGLPVMRALRSGRKAIADGPGKLCQALNITGQQNRASLSGPELFVTKRTQPAKWVTTPRIGIDYAENTRHKPWRFLAV